MHACKGQKTLKYYFGDLLSLNQKQFSENIWTRNVDQNPTHNSPNILRICDWFWSYFWKVSKFQATLVLRISKLKIEKIITKIKNIIYLFIIFTNYTFIKLVKMGEGHGWSIYSPHLKKTRTFLSCTKKKKRFDPSIFLFNLFCIQN